MRPVDEGLVARVGVDGGHQTLLDTEGIIENLDHRHEAVRGARRVRHDDVSLRIVGVLVHADDEGGVGTRTRRAHDDPLGAAFDVHGRLRPVGEDARGLDNDVDTEITPRQRLGIALGEHEELVAVDGDPVFGNLDRVRQSAHDRVVLQKMGKRLHRGEVVDGNELDVVTPRSGLLLHHRPKKVATDPAESIDADSHCHDVC